MIIIYKFSFLMEASILDASQKERTDMLKETALAIVKSTPVPAAGVALGVVSLGGLHAALVPAVQGVCALVAFVLAALVIAKICLFPGMFRSDMNSPVVAGTFATLFMCTMQLASFAAPFAGPVAFAVWAIAVACHAGLICWFTWRFVRGFKLQNVFTSWFVAYVGIIVGALTSPTFGMEALGRAIFVFGFACYAVLLVVVTVRHVRHELPEAAAPTFCIYAAPMSLSLAGYLAVFPQPNTVFVAVLAVLAQAMLLVVLVRLPRLLRLKFYPSYAAMTFPFVISATAFVRSLSCLAAEGWAVPEALSALAWLEAALATVMVCYVLCHYVRHIAVSARADLKAQALEAVAGTADAAAAQAARTR